MTEERICSHGHCSKPAPQGRLCWGCWSNEQNQKPCTQFCEICQRPIPVVGEGDMVRHVLDCRRKAINLNDPRDEHGALISMGLRHGRHDLDHYETNWGTP